MKAISQVLFQAIEMLGDPSSPGQRKPVATVTASSNDTVDGKETAPDLLPALPQSDTDQRRSVRRPAYNSTPARQSAVTVAPTSRTMIRKKESNASQATLLESTFMGLETDRQETKIKADYALSRPAEYCDACQSGKQELDCCHHIRCPKNPSFDEARFRRMVKGCTQGCKSCMVEIKNGYTKRRHDMCDLNKDAQTETKATIQPLPFCRACLTKKSIHHQLCPQHEHFGTSGAAKKLELLLAGVKIGCQASHTEYESGTASRRLHAGKCERRYQGDRTKHQPNQSKKVIVRGRASSKTKQPVLTELPAANKPAQQKPTKDSDTKENEEIQQAVARSAKKRDRPPKVSSPSPTPTPRQGQVSEKELQQFCNSCQKQKGCHHALCLHHRNFESSGARGQLELLLAGVEAGCESCRQQYSTGGSPSFSKHHVKCPRYGRLGRRKRTCLSDVDVVPSRRHSKKESSPKPLVTVDHRNESDVYRPTKKLRRKETLTTPSADPASVVSNEKESSNQIPKTRVQAPKVTIADKKTESSHSRRRKRQEVARTELEPVVVRQKATREAPSCAQTKLAKPTIVRAKAGRRRTKALPKGIDSKKGRARPKEALPPPRIQTRRSTASNVVEGNTSTAAGSIGKRSSKGPFLDADRASVDHSDLPKQKGKVANGPTEEEMSLRTKAQQSAADKAPVSPGIAANVECDHQTTSEPMPVSNLTTIESTRGRQVPDQAEVNRKKHDARQKFLDSAFTIYDVSVPFCRACMNSSDGHHHSLCPKHPQFENSGALEKLERIRGGLKIGCALCMTQYETGASGKDGVRHSIRCTRLEKERQRKADEDSAETGETVERSPHEDDETRSTPKSFEGRTPSTIAKQNSKRRTNTNIVTPAVPDYEEERTQMRLDGHITVGRPTWKSCENPWGKMEYEEGDVVVSGDGGFTHHEVLVPGRRFVIDPFQVDSCYNETHFSPGEGVHVVKLTRDALTSVSWGFVIEHHDFGGACLVKEIDPLSPAAEAKFVGSASRSPLCVHDMILTVNGSDVGGMTEVGFELAMETSGVEVILGVSRYRFPTLVDRLNADMENETWVVLDRNVNDKRNLDWSELDLACNGTGIDTESLKRMESGFRFQDMTLPVDDSPPRYGCPHIEDHTLCPGTAQQGAINIESPPENVSIPKCAEDSNHTVLNDEIDVDDVSRAGSLQSEDWDDDDNPWVGCVCGKIHEAPSVVFWIQCESCDTWCNVAPACVGFDEDEAKFKVWTCRACPGTHNSEVDPAR